MLRPLESIVVMFLFALGMGATLYVRTLIDWSRLGISFDRAQRLVLLLLSLALVSAIVRSGMRPALRRVLTQTPSLALLLFLAVASSAWSIHRSHTLISSIMLSVTCVVSLYIGLHYTVEQILTLIIATVATLAMATIVSVTLSSATATHPDLAGAWRGVFEHKNFLGRSMLIGLVALLTKLRSPELGPWARSGHSLIVLLVVAVMLLSKSATAYVLAAIVLALSSYLPHVLRPVTRRDYAFATGGAAVAAVLGAAAIFNPARVLHYVGRDTTLTGRTELWDLLLPHMLQRPWLGFGYDVFWSRFGDSISESAGWRVPHPHNGYIQLVLDLGVVGLLVFACCFILTFYRAAMFYRRDSQPKNLFPILALFCLAAVNVVETRLIKFDDFWWMLFGTIVAITSAEGSCKHGALASVEIDGPVLGTGAPASMTRRGLSS